MIILSKLTNFFNICINLFAGLLALWLGDHRKDCELRREIVIFGLDFGVGDYLEFFKFRAQVAERAMVVGNGSPWSHGRLPDGPSTTGFLWCASKNFNFVEWYPYPFFSVHNYVLTRGASDISFSAIISHDLVRCKRWTFFSTVFCAVQFLHNSEDICNLYYFLKFRNFP